MGKFLPAVVLVGLLLFACAEETQPGGAGGSGTGGCDTSDPPTRDEGVLTVATDKPAYPPWFKGHPKHYGGFEGELATEVADRMQLDIKWVVEPFNKSYAPGAKDYDFDINEISVTPEREQAVDFSDGYFDNNQALLAMGDNQITGETSLAGLKGYQLGAQVGTTSLQFINEQIQPDKQVKIFDTTNDLKSALDAGQIDGFFTDVVTTVYLRDFEIKGSEVVGQYPTNEEFGLLFEQGSPLVDCVNQVLGEIKDDGTLQELADKHLQDYLSVQTFSDQ